MSLDHCAELLREHDADRFGMVLMAKPEARAKLLSLYALNLELARAPLASNEPLIAEMRVQWWIDQLGKLEGAAPRNHEILSPLYAAWGARASAFATLAEPRRQDAERLPHGDAQSVLDYIGQTAVPLTLFAAEALEMPAAAAPAVSAQAEGLGIAAWLQALPSLQGLNLGLATLDPAVLQELATHALDSLDRAAHAHGAVPKALAPALYPRAGTRKFLETLAKSGGIDAALAQIPSEFRRRFGLGLYALTGAWWIPLLR